jgi:putative transposase
MFTVRPLSHSGEHLLRDLLDASAALWNEVNYQRLMRYNDEDGFEGEDVWDADTGRLEGQYKGVLGAATAVPGYAFMENCEAVEGTDGKSRDEYTVTVERGDGSVEPTFTDPLGEE